MICCCGETFMNKSSLTDRKITHYHLNSLKHKYLMEMTLEEREQYHKDKYICECGSKFKKYDNTVMRQVLMRHRYTNKHMNYLAASNK